MLNQYIGKMTINMYYNDVRLEKSKYFKKVHCRLEINVLCRLSIKEKENKEEKRPQ